MPWVNVKIERNGVQNYLYQFSEEKINYLLKFIEAIAEDDEKTELSLLEEIEVGMKEVKKIRDGELPRKTLMEIIDVK